MSDHTHYEVIIIGGSYAGLSAAMALGRSFRKVLIIDSGKPCNRQTPHAHNFLTHDGEQPSEIASVAKAQVLRYDTVTFHDGLVETCYKVKNGFEITTKGGETFSTKKVLLATGVIDLMPSIPGFAECWGITALHCPYCHGYEVKDAAIGILGNGDIAFDLCRLISNWSKKLILFTNGITTLTAEQKEKLKSHHIEIVETAIQSLEHQDGYIQHINLKDGSLKKISAVFSRIGFTLSGEMHQQLGIELTEHGHIKVDDFGKTNIEGVFAAGDNTSMFRSLSIAIAAGGKAGAFINHELIQETF
jgi:thioredoxin reductase